MVLEVIIPNTIPVASARLINVSEGAKVSLNATVLLNAKASSDGDGDPLTYRWSNVESVYEIEDPASPEVSLVADKGGRFTFVLVVFDGDDWSVPDSVSLWVNSRPIAEAGADQSALYGDTITLDGTNSNDSDEDALSYRWTAEAYDLVDNSTPKPSLTLTNLNTVIVSLTVNDGQLDSGADELTISVERDEGNVPPVAQIATDITSVRAGSPIVLDGSASSDPDRSFALGYAWSIVSSQGEITPIDQKDSRVTVNPAEPGTVTYQLVVHDGQDPSEPTQVAIEVVEPNTVPVANAGEDRTVVVGTLIELNGTDSADGDGDALSYQWDVPSGLEINDVNDPTPTVLGVVAGEYTIQLTVDDGKGGIDQDRLQIIVKPPESGTVVIDVPWPEDPLDDLSDTGGAQSPDAATDTVAVVGNFDEGDGEAVDVSGHFVEDDEAVIEITGTIEGDLSGRSSESTGGTDDSGDGADAQTDTVTVSGTFEEGPGQSVDVTGQFVEDGKAVVEAKGTFEDADSDSAGNTDVSDDDQTEAGKGAESMVDVSATVVEVDSQDDVDIVITGGVVEASELDSIDVQVEGRVVDE